MNNAMESKESNNGRFQQVTEIWKCLLNGGKIRHEKWPDDEYVYVNDEGETVDERGIPMDIGILVIDPEEWYEWKLMGKVDIKDSRKLMSLLLDGVTVIEDVSEGCYNKFKLNTDNNLVTAYKEGQWHTSESFPNPEIYTVYYIKQGEENE